MSEIKALGKLRTAARNMAKGRNLENHEECNLLLLIADEIEREIVEHYMELPVDADGVPIHVGDILERVDGGPIQQACCIGPYGFNDAPIWCARDFRHVKPRTVEDVLCDMIHEYACTDMTTEQTAAKYAVEIRDLLGVDRCADEIRELMSCTTSARGTTGR